MKQRESVKVGKWTDTRLRVRASSEGRASILLTISSFPTRRTSSPPPRGLCVLRAPSGTQREQFGDGVKTRGDATHALHNNISFFSKPGGGGKADAALPPPPQPPGSKHAGGKVKGARRRRADQSDDMF